jgi:hypothetical protein
MKRTLALSAMAAIVAVVLQSAGCSDQPTTTPQVETAFSKGAFAAPTITIIDATENSITVRVTAGSTGAPAGFSLHWEKKSDYDTYGWTSGQYSYCGASFSGNANGSSYNLAAGASVDVVIGVGSYPGPGESGGCGPLECGFEFAIRGFAHANSSMNRSPFTSAVFGATDDCPETINCIHDLGWWKHHTSLWPAGHATGDEFFSTGETWLQWLNKPVGNNTPIKAAQDYILLKLNICNGANINGNQNYLALMTAVESYFGGNTAALDAWNSTYQQNKHLLTCDGDGTYCP